MSYSKSRLQIERITFGALFASVAIILKIFMSYETQFFAVRIFEIPIMVAGVLLGPLFGGFVGLVTDLVYSMVNARGLNVGINLFTLESMIYGIIPGLVFRIFIYNKFSISLSTIFTLLIAFTISTTQLFIWSYPETKTVIALLPYRVIVLLLKIPFEIFLINLLITNKSFYSISIYQRFFQKQKLFQ